MLIQLFDWIAALMTLLGMEVRQFKCARYVLTGRATCSSSHCHYCGYSFCDC